MRLLILLFFPFSLFAQFTYSLDGSIPIEVSGKVLQNAWAGGLNSPQINTMDLNGDGKADLVIFDKGATRISTFLAINNTYKYAPEYESLFPDDISTFFVLSDYNCDGKKDLFTFGQIGIYVYKNVTQPGQNLAWKKLSFFTTPGFKSEVLLTVGVSGNKINLLPGTNDLPVFTDMDGDGDMDVVNMRFVSPSQAEFHKNMSVEKGYGCDSLLLEKQLYSDYPNVNDGYGAFTECSCGKIAFQNQTCVSIGGRIEQIEHTGGKALLAIDMDNDGDKDLVFSEETCSSLYYLQNKGTTQNPVMDIAVPYPSVTPVNIDLYPAAYYEDVDFDGKPDLLSSPNQFSRTSITNNFTQSLFLYKNTGTAQLPNFSFVKRNFLQDEMIDAGDFSAPAFVDYDNDGDQDMFIGSYLIPNSIGKISAYENVGSSTSPSFRFITDDFAGISTFFLYNIKPQFIDIDKNGSPDLAMTATSGQTGVTSIYYLLSSSTTIPAFGGQSLQKFTFTMNMSDNVTLIDIDSDGRLDLLRGTSTGSLEYWRGNAQGGFTLSNNKYLGIGESLDRQFITAVAGDVDADGQDDLVVGNQDGRLSIYPSFRSNAAPQPLTSLFYDSFSKTYVSKKLGGSIRPVVANLYGNDKNEIVVGNTQGGLHVLKNENGAVLPAEPVIILSPNPLPLNQDLTIYADRPATLEIFTVLGKRLGQATLIPGNQNTIFPFRGVAAGIYIARFTTREKTTAIRFIVL